MIRKTTQSHRISPSAPQEHAGTKPGRKADPDALLSVGEAALEIGIYPSKVSRAMVSGRLSFQRLGGNKWRFVRRSDLLAWAEGLEAR